jgi:hypothetical protein
VQAWSHVAPTLNQGFSPSSLGDEAQVGFHGVMLAKYHFTMLVHLLYLEKEERRNLKRRDRPNLWVHFAMLVNLIS